MSETMFMLLVLSIPAILLLGMGVIICIWLLEWEKDIATRRKKLNDFKESRGSE